MEILFKKKMKPPQLLLTIAGEGGSGKSTLVKTIVGTLRRMFQSNSCVKVAAPTGSASFNGGGVTMHRLFNLPVQTNTHLLQNEKLVKLRKAFRDIVCLIFDERSMIGADDMGMMDNIVNRLCAMEQMQQNHLEAFLL